MTHQYQVSTAAAARLLLSAARISAKAVNLVADVIEGRLNPDDCSWEELGNEAVALGLDLSRAIARSQRARQVARARRSANPPAPETTVAESGATPADVISEMRRTSGGMEKFYRWPDRSWRRTPPTLADVALFEQSRKRRRR